MRVFAFRSIARHTKSGISHLVWLYHPRTWREKGALWVSGLVIGTYWAIVSGLGIYWSFEPAIFDVQEHALQMAGGNESKLVPGYVLTATGVKIAETILHKPGGYLRNDIAPPGIYLDNKPAWEYGALFQLRDLARDLRNNLSRAGTQSREDRDLRNADAHFSFDSESWILPSTESEYRKGIRALRSYAERLTNNDPTDGFFSARGDNINIYLITIGQRLGDMAQRLGASVGYVTYAVGTIATEDLTAPQAVELTKFSSTTPWYEVDDVFYEVRGGTWALLHILRAIEIDFRKTLRDKNAEIPMRQIIRELEHAQEAVVSPIILNGHGFGVIANHSLVMASYLARANAALIDLRILIREG